MWFEPKSGQTRHNAQQKLLKKCRTKVRSDQVCRKGLLLKNPYGLTHLEMG